MDALTPLKFTNGNDTCPINLSIIFFLHFALLAPPGNVQLRASKFKACVNDVITLNCTAHSKFSVDTYQLFENETRALDASNLGVWVKRMSKGGLFVYKCSAKNVGGTGNSTAVIVIVNGK